MKRAFLYFSAAHLVALSLFSGAHAFAPRAIFRPSVSPRWGLRSSSGEYSETEVQEMKYLILSLSIESTDHDRRTRVKEIFHEALGRPNGGPKRFTELFDKVLIEVGDEVQNEAKKKQFSDQAAAQSSDSGYTKSDAATDESEEVVDNQEPITREKSPEELQLWALVDMMVQTKTIVKKENGDLGSKGAFQ